MQIRVYYEDTDAGGIVYHSNYINFCERARSEIFFQNGLSPSLDSGQFVARKVVADYIASAKLGDILEIKTELLELKRASCILLQTIYRENKKIFTMQITLAYITYEGRPQKIDERARDLILLFSQSNKFRN